MILHVCTHTHIHCTCIHSVIYVQAGGQQIDHTPKHSFFTHTHKACIYTSLSYQKRRGLLIIYTCTHDTIMYTHIYIVHAYTHAHSVIILMLRRILVAYQNRKGNSNGSLKAFSMIIELYVQVWSE